MGVTLDDQRDGSGRLCAQHWIVDREHVRAELLDELGDDRRLLGLGVLRLPGARLVVGGERRVGDPENPDAADLDELTVEHGHIGDPRQGGADFGRVMVSGDEVVRHGHGAEDVSDAGFDREAERREVTSVHDGSGPELPGQPRCELEAQRVEVDVTDVQDRRISGTWLGLGRCRLVQVRELATQDVDAPSHVLEAVDMALDGLQHVRRFLQRTHELRRLESSGVERGPRQPEDQRRARHTPRHAGHHQSRPPGAGQPPRGVPRRHPRR